jgi:hypothetical protein
MQWKTTMAKRPDLDSLVVPKGGEPAGPAAAEAVKGYAHTLSLRLTAEQYRRLRRYVADQEDKTGKRVTHQAIIETALDEYLTKLGG